MKWIFLIPIIILCAACNDEVFVKRPGAEVPEPEEPTTPPEKPDPVFTDSMKIQSFWYRDEPLTVDPDEWVIEGVTHFTNYTASSGVAVIFDNYNSSFVQISNNTYYVYPWAKEQITIPLPGLNEDGVPGFYGSEMVFSPGFSVLPKQFRAGHIERFDLPANSKVTATVYTVRKTVKAVADCKYYNTEFPSSIEDGFWNVSVSVPVKIYVEWSEVTPAE